MRGGDRLEVVSGIVPRLDVAPAPPLVVLAPYRSSRDGNAGFSRLGGADELKHRRIAAHQLAERPDERKGQREHQSRVSLGEPAQLLRHPARVPLTRYL